MTGSVRGLDGATLLPTLGHGCNKARRELGYGAVAQPAIKSRNVTCDRSPDLQDHWDRLGEVLRRKRLGTN
jgi:hypothetical protein